MNRRTFLAAGAGALVMAGQNRVKVPGTLALRTRRREGGRVVEKNLRWEVAQTAIIVCDMWDAHTCLLSAQRVAALAPRMNQVINAARSLGVMIVHAPSDTMKYYEGTPWRQRMQRAPTAPSPFPLLARCAREPLEEKAWPIDDAAGGCDDPVVVKETGPPYPWTREHPAIDIVGFDGVSDSGQEIYNFFRQEGITNVALMGVHTNICILPPRRLSSLNTSEEHRPSDHPKSREALSVLNRVAERLLHGLRSHLPPELEMPASYHTLHPPSAGRPAKPRLTRTVSLVFSKVGPGTPYEEPEILARLRAELTSLGIPYIGGAGRGACQ